MKIENPMKHFYGVFTCILLWNDELRPQKRDAPRRVDHRQKRQSAPQFPEGALKQGSRVSAIFMIRVYAPVHARWLNNDERRG